MEKRYQVFISSTFMDLKEERQSALRAVLELDHMPAGMELFPAADDSAWQLIKDVIDASDYYVLIVGGRYGSLDDEGIGYTEKEYDYAVSTKKPVVPLLHENPDNLPRDRTETNLASWEKLEAFRKKVEKRHTCVYWVSANELKAKLIIGLTAAAKRNPAIGWVRADQVPSGAMVSDVLALRQRVEELEGELEVERIGPPPGTDDLLQGNDVFEINFHFYSRREIKTRPFYKDSGWKASIKPTWDEIFAGVAPKMINEISDEDLRSAFEDLFTRLAKIDYGEDDDFKGQRLHSFKFDNEDLDTLIVQLRALGLINNSHKKRSLKDTSTYWTLTPFGDRKMVVHCAIHRTPSRSRKPGVKSSSP